MNIWSIAVGRWATGTIVYNFQNYYGDVARHDVGVGTAFTLRIGLTVEGYIHILDLAPGQASAVLSVHTILESRLERGWVVHLWLLCIMGACMGWIPRCKRCSRRDPDTAISDPGMGARDLSPEDHRHFCGALTRTGNT